MSPERDLIVRYLRHIARVEVGTILSPESRAVVDWCAGWIENDLDLAWQQQLAENTAAAEGARTAATDYRKLISEEGMPAVDSPSDISMQEVILSLRLAGAAARALGKTLLDLQAQIDKKLPKDP